jgi:hypothetical protein
MALTLFFPGNLLEVYPQLCLQLLNEAPDDQPFLLTFCHRAPHDSITALPEHADLFAYDTMPFPDNFYEYANNYPSYYASWQLNWHPDTAETIEIKREKIPGLKRCGSGCTTVIRLAGIQGPDGSNHDYLHQ